MRGTHRGDEPSSRPPSVGVGLGSSSHPRFIFFRNFSVLFWTPSPCLWAASGTDAPRCASIATEPRRWPQATSSTGLTVTLSQGVGWFDAPRSHNLPPPLFFLPNFLLHFSRPTSERPHFHAEDLRPFLACRLPDADTVYRGLSRPAESSPLVVEPEAKARPVRAVSARSLGS